MGKFVKKKSWLNYHFNILTNVSLFLFILQHNVTHTVQNSLKPHIYAMYACMNTADGLRMFNFKLRLYMTSKLPAILTVG